MNDSASKLNEIKRRVLPYSNHVISYIKFLFSESRKFYKNFSNSCWFLPASKNVKVLEKLMLFFNMRREILYCLNLMLILWFIQTNCLLIELLLVSVYFMWFIWLFVLYVEHYIIFKFYFSTCKIDTCVM